MCSCEWETYVCALCSFSFFVAGAAVAAAASFSSLPSTRSFPVVGFSSCVFLVFVSAIFSLLFSFFFLWVGYAFSISAVVVSLLCFYHRHIHIHTHHAHALVLCENLCERHSYCVCMKQSPDIVFTGWAWPFRELWTVIGKSVYTHVYCVRCTYTPCTFTLYIIGYALHPPIQLVCLCQCMFATYVCETILCSALIIAVNDGRPRF